MYNNILDVYKSLYLMSDNITGETIDYNRGFQDAIYMLHLTLKRYEHINLHVENKHLSRSLYLAQLALDDRYEDRAVLKQRIVELEDEVKSLRKKEIKISPKLTTDKFVKCALEVNGYTAEFFADTDQETVNGYLGAIGDYISNRLSKTRRKGKPMHTADYRVWCMEVLRNNGIKCITK